MAGAVDGQFPDGSGSARRMDSASTKQFVQLLTAHEERLFGYVYSLIGNAADTSDVLQEAAVTIWQHYSEYDPSRPFFPWAARFAYFSVLAFRKRSRVTPQLLGDEAVAAISQDYTSQEEDLHKRLDALRLCLDKLPAPARRLFEQHYRERQTIQAIAAKTGRNLNTLYKAFTKIRRWLLDCVQEVLAKGVA